MDKQYWLMKWECSDTHFNQDKPNRYLQKYLSSLNLYSNDRILIPLCGKSIDMLWLLSQGYNVIGIECSEIACREFFEENKLEFNIINKEKFIVYEHQNIELFCGDFFDFTPNLTQPFHAVYDRAALIALPDDLRTRYAQHLENLFQDKGSILLISHTYDQTIMPGPPFSVSEQAVNQLYNKHFNIKKLYDEKATAIPNHLKQKGLTQASEQIYYLEYKT